MLMKLVLILFPLKHLNIHDKSYSNIKSLSKNSSSKKLKKLPPCGPQYNLRAHQS